MSLRLLFVFPGCGAQHCWDLHKRFRRERKRDPVCGDDTRLL